MKLLDEEKRSRCIATQLDDSDDDYPQTYVVHDVKFRVRYFVFVLFIFSIFDPALIHFIFNIFT